MRDRSDIDIMYNFLKGYVSVRNKMSNNLIFMSLFKKRNEFIENNFFPSSLSRNVGSFDNFSFIFIEAVFERFLCMILHLY